MNRGPLQRENEIVRSVLGRETVGDPESRTADYPLQDVVRPSRWLEAQQFDGWEWDGAAPKFVELKHARYLRFRFVRQLEVPDQLNG